MADIHCDVAIVGLGLSGLSSAWQLTKAGVKVVGFEKFAYSGAIGTSSAGYTRVIRIASTDPELQEHAVTDFKEWRDLEKLSGKKIINMTGGVSLGRRGFPQMDYLLKNSVAKGDQVLSAEELMKKYPALKLASNYCGIVTEDMGFVDTKNALYSLRTESEKRGAVFHYECEVTKMDEETKKFVIDTPSGVKTVNYNTLVMATGPYTPNFKQEKGAEPI